MASSDVAAGAGALKDVRDGDTSAYSGGDGVLLNDAASINWSSEFMSSRRSTLQGCLWPVGFFLIFATRLENGGCKFITSGLD
jgi:hypothetical protein